jgi:multiple sugar transport system permease protein
MDKVKRSLKTFSLRPYFFLLPSIFFLFLFIIYPIFEIIYSSFFYITPKGEERFVGLQNYLDLFSDSVFVWSLKNTILWVILRVTLMLILGLGIALLINYPFRGNSIIETILIIPWAMPLAIVCYGWKWMLNGPYGHFNSLLNILGLISQPFPEWLGSPLGAFLGVLGVSVYTGLPFTTLIYLSGLKSIPESLYEAALIDGASIWQRFRYITLPQLRAVVITIILLETIISFGSFTTVWIVTLGGPLHYTELIVTYLYKVAFEFFNWAKAFTIATIGFIILFIFSFIYISKTWRE